LISIEVESLPVIPAGFPSPAEEHYDGPLDLNDLIRNPTATFILRVSGWSMRDAGIADGDIILVDRSLRPVDGSIVVALVDNDGFTVKTLRTTPPRLEPANPDFPAIPVPEDGIEIWGVVTTVIHRVSRGAPHAR
jgi:DNA polymerase V